MDVVKDDMQRLGEDPGDRVRWRQMIDYEDEEDFTFIT